MYQERVYALYSKGLLAGNNNNLFTRNELASLVHSFYTCLKQSYASDSDNNCTLQINLGSEVVYMVIYLT